MSYERSNETLVLLTLAGDNGAYEELVKRHEKAVYASALAVTHAHHLAEDSTQDAFVSAWMKLNTLSEPSKFGAWVCQIAKNCAKNTLLRYHAFLPLESAEWHPAELSCEPEETLIASETNKELRETVAKLPEKVRRVIELHYFSDLPIEKIAEKLGVRVGTVKSQLFEGRRRLRKGLSAMNERIDDTLTEKVMKKVEELKLWQLKNDKTGFEKVYEDVLSQVEALPESDRKHHAIADVLLRGYWWLPGKANDELLARIKESALRGGNDEAMIYICTREDQKLYGKDRIDFMRGVQIPLLEKAGLSGALAREWYWLAAGYFSEDETEKARDAWLSAEKAGKEGDPYKYFAPAGRRLREKKLEKYKDEPIGRFSVGAHLIEVRTINGQLRRLGYGLADSAGENHEAILYNNLWLYASYSDGRYFDEDLAVGQAAKGSDGSLLTRLPDETVVTPAGTFEGCRTFETKSGDLADVYRVWYKEGVGAVKFACRVLGMSSEVLLCSYTVVGGKGLLPVAVGNRWSYEEPANAAYRESRYDSEIVYADGEKAYILTEEEAYRKKYDENSFRDMILQTAQDYVRYVSRWDARINDVSIPVKRAEELAATPLEKAYIRAAASVARRIMETDGEFNPKRSASGHWNFFNYNILYKKDGRILQTDYDSRYCFEWKCGDSSSVVDAVLYNDIYGLLLDCAGCLWDDGWADGFSDDDAHDFAGDPVHTALSVSDGGRIETEAGVFERTLKLTVDTSGFDDGWSYRGGKKEYWFCEGVGIVRAVFCLKDMRKVTFDLAEYTGKGEGWFPYKDGLRRFYRAVDLTDGCVASADYVYVENEGRIVIFSDRCGVREFGPKITQYSFIDGELEVERLCNQNKNKESRTQGQINTFRVFTHMLCRSVGILYGHEEIASAWGKQKMRFIESISYEGKIPDAWLGLYAEKAFRAACPTLGMRKLDGRSLDEGFEMLFKALDLYEKWSEIPDGTELDTGDPLIFGGIKLYKGKEYMKLPDGSLAPLDYAEDFAPDPSIPYRGLTAEHGWEWFNPAREDPRYPVAIDRARAIRDKYRK